MRIMPHVIITPSGIQILLYGFENFKAAIKLEVHLKLLPPPPPHVPMEVVLGKFGPGPIGTRSGPDQTLQSRSRSGIFPKILDRSVSGLGILKLRETVSDPVWTRTA